MQPVREVQEAVVHRHDQVGDQAGHRERPALLLDALDLDHLVGLPAAVRLMPAPHRARQRGADVALRRGRVVEEAHLERDQPLVSEVDRLLDAALLEVPEVQVSPVLAGRHVVRVEARLVGLGDPELGRDHDVVPRLVPEVVVDPLVAAVGLPAPDHLERARVELCEAAAVASVLVAEHADHDLVAGHAVHGVRARVPGLGHHLLGLDHLLDRRPAGIVGHVHDVDPRRAEPGNDQVRPVGPVAGRAAPVPPVVVQLVADTRHRQLGDDPAVLRRVRIGADHGQEVGPIHAGALVQAGDVQVLLVRRLDRLVRRGEQRCALVGRVV